MFMQDKNFFDEYTRSFSTTYFNLSVPFCVYGTRDVFKLNLPMQNLTLGVRLISLINQTYYDYKTQNYLIKNSPETDAYSSNTPIKSRVRGLIEQIKFLTETDQ